MGDLRHLAKMWISLVTLAIAVSFSQACGTPLLFSSDSHAPANSSSAQMSGGNGDSYGGKLTVFVSFDPARACSEKDMSGNPLPDSQIYLFPDQRVELVRRDCLDLDRPLPIAFTDLVFNGDGSVTYQGKRYIVLLARDDFSVVAARCPAGYAPKPNSTRLNLVLGSQNLTDRAVWFNHVGIGTGLSGSLGSLFRFLISRDDPANLDFWRRIHQTDFPLDAGRTYAYSFLAQPGSVASAWFSARTEGRYELSLVFDLVTGQVTEQRVVGIPSYTTMSRPLGSGRFITVYFETPGGGSSTVIGITPDGTLTKAPAVGDSIYATAVQLEDVASFCTKL